VGVGVGRGEGGAQKERMCGCVRVCRCVRVCVVDGTGLRRCIGCF